MGYFGYRAVDASGGAVKGFIEASSLEEAAKKLRESRLYPTKIKPVKKGFQRRIPQDVVIAFCKDLAELLSAGLPIDRSLALLVQQQHHPVFRRITQDILRSVQEGKALSDAIEKHDDVFGSLISHMVRAGEVSGALEAVLLRLGEYLERRRAFAQNLLSASLYPLMLIAMSFLSMGVLLVYVIPRFAKIFEDLNQSVPLITQILLSLGNTIERYGWLIPPSLVVVFIAARHLYTSPRGKQHLDVLFLRLPVVRRLTLSTNLSRCFLAMGTMVQAGVPLLRAITLARNVINNHVIKTETTPLYDSVKAGKPVSSVFAGNNRFPPRIATMLQLGEEKGALGETLLALGTYFERETEKILRRLITFLEPAVIVGTGLIIALMVLSMFSAIIGISDIRF